MIKSLLIIIFTSIITIKSFDIVYGYIKSDNIVSKGSNITNRSIVLREFGKPGTYLNSPTKNYHAAASNLEFKEYEIIIDRDGFISSYNDYKKYDFKKQQNNINPEYADIIFFGGSTTEGLFVNHKDRFPSVVENDISTIIKKQIRVLNSGVSGNHTLHSIFLLQAKGLKYKPKIAVLMNNVNDYSLLSKTGSYFKAPPNRSIIDIGNNSRTWISYKILRKIKNVLMPHIYDGFLRDYKYIIFKSPDDFESIRGNKLFSPEVALLEYEKAVNTFVSICLDWNIEPILMTQANRIDPTVERHYFSEKDKAELDIYWEYHELFNNKLREIAKNKKVKLIDLALSLVNGKKQYIYDTVHLNSEGSRLVGNIISEQLVEYFE